MPTFSDPYQVLDLIDQGQKPFPFYVLAGSDEYFLDKIEKKIFSTYIQEEEVDFNYTLLYGKDASVEELVTSVRRYPMMSAHVLVVLKDAQDFAKLDLALESLLKSPTENSILVLIYRGKKPDTRLKTFKEIAKTGLFYESKPIPEWAMEGYVTRMAKKYRLSLEPLALQLLVNNIGNNLSRLDKEMQKLNLALPSSNRIVRADLVEQYTGISREFNSFELLRAIIKKDLQKAFKIGIELSKDQKKSPIQITLSVLYNYFSNLFVAHHSSPRTQVQIQSDLELKSSYATKDYLEGLRHFSLPHTVRIISYIRKCDARSKGLYGYEINPEAILRDLIYFILY